MKRLFYYINIISLLFALSACRPQPDDEVDTNIPEGYTRITFKTRISELENVNLRDVDPDGLGVNNMTLFCFNEFGLYISKSAATLKAQDHETGTYEAIIPSQTDIIHFLGNHSEGLYDDSNFPGQTESMVIANMEGGSGMLVYWSRFQMDKNSDMDIHKQLANISHVVNGTTYKGIKLIRNQAKVSINDWDTQHMTISGFRTVNIQAFGTVAPHHPDLHFNIVEDWEQQEDFITLPNNKAKMSDIVDINTKQEDYIFESENEGDNLVSVIIKGRPKSSTTGKDLYYRVVMQDNNGNSFMIRRNHHYKINIIGELSYGQNTFAEALVAPATNNAWISIDSWVNEISNGIETLWIEQTSYVLSSEEYAGKNWTIPYKYTNKNGNNTAPTITWIENNVAYNNIGNNYNASTGQGTITLNLHPMYEGNEQQSGKLLIKHGKLQREIEIILIRKQLFTPVWISAQVYSGSANENVTMMFTIPETCPESLFPFTVLVSANHLDVRAESGDQLPVLIKGEEGYFGQEWEGINYKYAYTVTAPGKHRLFFHTILEHEDEDREDVHLEAQFFETITKSVVFSGHGSHRALFVEGLHEYGNHHADDEVLYYMLVPAKKASPQMFTISLKERQNDGTYTNINHADKSDITQWHKNGHDEFLFYTKYLTFYDELFDESHEGFEEIKNQEWECEVVMINEDVWSTNGRVLGLRTFGYKEADPKYGLQEDGTYNVYMLTNDSRNTDVVRIASNNLMSKYVFDKDRTGTPYGNSLYAGNEYRSVIFDIGRYRPFRFASQIKISDKNGANSVTHGTILNNETHGETEELTEEITLRYEPGQKVDVILDITSFKGSDGRSVHPFGDIYGESFEIYIDAPMLRIDTERIPDSWFAANNPALKVDKLRRHPSIEGRFIYTVDQFRDRERNFGFAEAQNKDAAKTEYNKFGEVVPVATSIDQSGERKLLPFVKATITTKYNITISSEKDKVMFWDKTFKVKTQHIEGNIKYRTSNGDLHNLPKDAFVAFVRHYTGARIGVMTIHDNSRYELNLRHEYKFDWEGDPIELFYTIDDVTYSAKIDDLATLFQMSKDNETIILER